MKIKVIPEGREGVYVPEKRSLIKWIRKQNFETIHHAFAIGSMIVGADWDVGRVIDRILEGERIAILTKGHKNMGHSLAIIFENKLNILDIGEISLNDLDITAKRQETSNKEE